MVEIVFFVFFLASDFLLVLCSQSLFFSSPPQGPMTSDFEGFLSQILSITFLTILILEREPVFPFFNVECDEWSK